MNSNILYIIIFIIIIIILIIAVAWIISFSSDTTCPKSIPFSKKWFGKGLFVGNDIPSNLPTGQYTEEIELEFTTFCPPEVQMVAKWRVLNKNNQTLVSGEDVGAGIIQNNGTMLLSNANSPSSILITPLKNNNLKYTLTLIAPNKNSSSGVVDVILYPVD